MEEHGEARGSKDTGAVRSSGLGRPNWPSAQDKGDGRGGFWIGEDGGWLVGDVDRWVDREGRGVLWLGRWIGRDPDVEWRRPKGNDGTSP